LIPESRQDLTYRLTPKGREAILAVLRSGYGCMEGLRPLERDDLEDIASSLYKMVHACLDATEPPGKWSLTHSRKIDPGEEAHVILRIDQYLSDLAAYRDDCHLAAWRVYPVDGHAWELLTVLWREGTFNLEAHADLFTRRGFEPEETLAALGDLKELAWVRADEGVYKLTTEGKAVRQSAEEATDDYFYKPWSFLSEKDIQALQAGLCRLKDALSM
jgi:DNA-binding PadR family transcriptional regulator